MPALQVSILRIGQYDSNIPTLIDGGGFGGGGGGGRGGSSSGGQSELSKMINKYALRIYSNFRVDNWESYPWNYYEACKCWVAENRRTGQ